MKVPLGRVSLAGVVAALVLAAAGCGGNDNGGGGSGATTNGGKGVPQGHKGGELTFLSAADVDYVDPGQTYYVFGFMVQEATNRALYSFKPDNSSDPVPDLATGDPQISSDNKTITVKIRKGVKYAPPVSREVTSKDIKYAFERAFSKNVPNGYAGTYFSSLVGAPSQPNTGPIKPISGIQTPDKYTIVFKLSEPQAPLVSQALVMPITVPVPEEYARKFDEHNPSTYDKNVAFTGPYMIRNDSKGALTGWSQGKRMELVRNPNWDAKTDFRPAYLDRVNIDMGNDDLTVATRRALNGSNVACCDAGLPPAPVLKQAVSRFKDQIVFAPAGGTRYASFNTTIKPFDNLNVRKAIIAASDREALRLARGGRFVGDIANGFLPPGLPGFEESGGLEQNTDLDFLAKPAGDPALAKKYMLAAKQDGVPVSADGKYTGPGNILTVATNADPNKQMAEVFQFQIEKLGFKLNMRLVPRNTELTRFCDRPASKVAICPTVGWFKDFTDPQSMLDATFNGDRILEQGNSNWPQLDVPEINRAMADASELPVGKARDEAWAKINRMVTEQAPALPIVWDKTATVFSKDVQGVVNEYSTTLDLNYTSLE
jgi:peptide/nickel transport system substrate-binding protein